jgi:monothiol glutaredoxin
MEKPEITAYLKPHCGWSRGVRAIFDKYELPYHDKDIINHPENRFEMEQLSGQPLSPCVIVNGTMLADVSGEEVEAYMLEQGLISPNEKGVDVPTNAPCSDEEHEEQARAAAAATGTIQFFPPKKS